MGGNRAAEADGTQQCRTLGAYGNDVNGDAAIKDEAHHCADHVGIQAAAQTAAGGEEDERGMGNGAHLQQGMQFLRAADRRQVADDRANPLRIGS